MSLTDEINQSLGQMQNEIEKLRDGELIKSIKPFIEKTSELISKLDSLNLATKQDLIESNKILGNQIEKLQQKVNSNELEQNKKLKHLNILVLIILLISIISIMIQFIH